MDNIIQEKIKKEAEGYGKLAPAFIEGAKFALENQWINVEDDLPYNHEELLMNHRFTKCVITRYKGGHISFDRMAKISDGYWKFAGAVTHWMSIPEVPKE